MLQLAITIQGITPLLLNRFSDEAAASATAGTRASIATDHLPPKDDAESRLYLDEKGQWIIPQPNLFRCIIDAGKFFKAGKTKITTLKSSLIPAAVTMTEVYYPLKSKKGWTVDTRPVRIPATGGRILRHRPLFNDWGLSFKCELDETMITAKLFREIVDAGGRRIGLGDFRPDCKGVFGKFVVQKWS